MRVNVINNSCFKGTYFLTSDIHAKPISCIGLFQKIKEKSEDTTSSIYIDNGDFYTNQSSIMTQIFTTFANKTPKIQKVLNFGNCEYELLRDHTEYALNEFNKLKKAGINIICSPIAEISKKIGLSPKQTTNIKPYAILKDNINGINRDVLIVGSVDTKGDCGLTPEKQGKILADIIKEARKKHDPYKTILVSHNTIDDTKKILDELKNEGADDIELVAGGHSHRIEDAIYEGVRILHAAPQGLSAYMVQSDEDGFHMKPVMYDKVSRYDYTMQETQGNDGIIDNLSFNPDFMENDYAKIVQKTDLLEKITKCTKEIKGREAGLKVSYPSEFGTIMANKMKEITGADLAIMISQDIRGKLPPIGRNIHKYDVINVMNVDKPIWILNVNKEELFEIFNISLKNQHKGDTNSDFLEYSNNIIIERYTDISDEDTDTPKEKRIKEIYIKEGSEWVPLSAIKKDRFKVACCDYLAQGKRFSLSYFNSIKDKEECKLIPTTRVLFTQALKEIQEGKKPIEKSIIVDSKKY